MKNFRRSLKGISPIFATLILIAIAVIAGVVVYMFTSGTLATMTGGGTAAQEKVSVQAATYNAVTPFSVTVYAQSTSGPNPVVSSIIIKDSSGNTVTVLDIGTLAPVTTTKTLATGILYTIPSATFTTALTPGTYTATLVTKAGGSFVSPSFTVS